MKAYRGTSFCSRALFGLAVMLIAGCGKEQVEERAPVARPVKTMVVGGEQGGMRTFPGTTQAADRVELSFRVGGPLIELSVNEGQHVRKGNVLARIDPRDYQIALDRAKAEFNKADADVKRYKRLYEQDAVPLADLELRQAQYDVANAQQDDAEANLSDTYLKAPFDGEIGEKYVDNREDVRPKQPILSLHGVDVVEIVIDVPEVARARFTPDNPRDLHAVAAFFFAEGREFDLELKEFAAAADPRTQTYKVTLTMPQPEDLNIRPGMTAEVRVYATGSLLPAYTEFVVPAHAVFAGDDGTQFVWVVDDGEQTVHQRQVSVGEVTGTEGIRVTSGLEPGDRIVVTGVTQLREGMKIRLMN